MAYPTTAELVAASSVAELTSLTSTEQDSLRAIAISDIEQFTGQHFDPRPGTRLLDSDGTKELYLEERLAEIDSLVVSKSALDATGVVLSDRRDRLHLKAELGQLGYAARALMDLSGDSYAFTPGFGTVQITGTWGWLESEFPEVIGEAIRFDMEDLARAQDGSTVAAVADYQRLGVRSASQGDVSFSFRDNGYGPALVSERVKALLVGYIWPGAAGRRV